MKKTLIIIFSSLMAVCLITVAVLLCIPNKNDDLRFLTDETVGVWWWTNQEEDKYLDFAKNNDVDEIYYCDYSLDDETSQFVKKAKAKGFKVFALFGECEWVEDHAGLDALIQKYRIYQAMHSDAMFHGIHLDIEPHQLNSFEYDRKNLLTKFVEMADDIVLSNSDITFDFDIPAWFDDEILFNGNLKSVYKHIIDIANRVFVMSYRDSAEAIVSFASDELAYAKSKNKQIALSVEMDSDEGENVSFKEENKKILYNELSKLGGLLDQKFLISIHNIESWFNLKEN